MLEQFEINLITQKEDTKEYSFQVDDEFFESVGSSDITKGNIDARITVSRLADESYECILNLKGEVQVLCDRCLDLLSIPVDSKNRLIVKLGSDYSEEDDIITIPEESGVFDASSFIYQFVELGIPIKHVHAPGKCNAQMIEALKKHLATRSDGDADETETDIDEEGDGDNHPIDPRWNELLKIKNNN